MRRKRIWFGVLVAILLVVSGVGLWRAYHSPAPTSTAKKQPAAKAAARLDPLEIGAIKARSYAASAITESENLGTRYGHPESVVSFSSDGIKEYALLGTPTSAKPAAGYPVIVLLHGYIVPDSYSTTSGNYHDWIASWVRAGYMVVMPDFRGNGNSEGTASSGHYAPEYTYDALNLIASLKADARVDKSRIGVAGHSMGGHIALRVAVASENVKATMVASGVVGSMEDLFFNWPRSPSRNDQPTTVVRGQLQELIKTHGDPRTNPDFWSKASAINYVGSIAGPVQINHSVADSTVPALFSRHLSQALMKAGKTSTLNEYPGDDHQFAGATNHSLLLQRTTDFWKQNL